MSSLRIDPETDEISFIGNRSADGSFAPAFHVNQRVLALRDGIFCPATVEAIETAQQSGSNGGIRFHYYIHFADADRRLDMWLEADSLRSAVGGPRRATKSNAQPLSSVMRSVGLRRQQQQLAAAAEEQRRGGTTSGSRGTSEANVPTQIRGNSSEAPPATQLLLQQQGSVGGGGSSNNLQQLATQQGPVSNAGKHGHHSHSARNTDSKFFDRPKNVARFYIGENEVEGWYYSPYLLAHPTVRRLLHEAQNNNVWQTIPNNASVSISSKQKQQLQTQQNQQQQQPSSSLVEDPTSIRDFSLHICPYCLEPALDHATIATHLCCCNLRPPGREVYRDTSKNKIIVFECDGAVHVSFARHLALLSKAFLEHKTLDADTTPFVFYVVCRITTYGCEVCGYFSREKRSDMGYNLSCILTLPQFQAQGLGRFMIDISYEMSRREGRPGTPEKPLSDFGERMYHSAWRDRVLDALSTHSCLEHQAVSLDQLIKATGMIRADVCTALGQLKILDQKALPTIAIVLDTEIVRKHLVSRIKRMKQHVVFEPALLHWFPHWYSATRALSSLGRLPAEIHVPSEEAMERALEAAKPGGGGAAGQQQDDGDYKKPKKAAAAAASSKKSSGTRRQRE